MTRACTNLAQLLDAFCGAHGASDGRIQTLKSAVGHLVAAGKAASAETVPLSDWQGRLGALERHLNRRGLASKSVATYLSALRRLMAWAVTAGLVARRPDPAVLATWYGLVCTYATTTGPRRRVPGALKAFGEFAALRGLRPGDVRPSDFLAYQQYLKQGPSGRRWRGRYQALTDAWHQAAEQGLVPELVFPAPPAPRRPYGIPLDHWPPALRRKFEDYLAWDMAGAGTGRAVARPLGPAGQQRIESFARRLVGFLVRVEGRRLTDLVFADLTDADHLAAFMNWHVDRNGRVTEEHRDWLRWAIRVRRHYFHLATATLEEMRDSLAPTHPDRPADRLPFSDAERLADAIREERHSIDPAHPGRGGSYAIRVARLARVELAVRLFAARLLRQINVRNLRLGENLKRDAEGRWILTFPADQMKQRRPYLAAFPADVVDLLEEYVTVHRPVLLGGKESPYLFVTSGGRPLRAPDVWDLISRAARRHLGMSINPHAFRHMGATGYIADNPGDYVTPMLLLGHASVETTLDVYTHLEQNAAARLFDRLRQGQARA